MFLPAWNASTPPACRPLMSRRLLFRPAAEADLDGIDDYIARDSPERAFAFVQRIRGACETLRQFLRADAPAMIFRQA